MFSSLFEPGGWPFWALIGISVYLSLCVFRFMRDDLSCDFSPSACVSFIPPLVAVVLIYLFGTTAIFDWLVFKDPNMFTIFALGTWCFYLLIGAELIGLVCCLRYQRGVAAAMSILFTLFLLQVFGGVPVVAYVLGHPIQTIAAVVGYFVVGGGGWSLYSWNRYSKKAKEAYQEQRDNFLTAHGCDPKAEFPEALWPEFKKTILTWTDVEFFPDYRKHKSEILGWIVAWPLSMIEVFVLDFLLNLADWVYSKLSDAFYAIMLRQWKQYQADLELDKRLKKKQ